MKRVACLLLAVLCISSVANAQKNPYVDSLKKVIALSTGIARYDAWFKLVDAYRMNEQYPLAISTATTYKNFAQKEGNQLELVKAYALITHIYGNQELFTDAQLYQDSALLAAGDSRNVLVTAYANYASAVFYYAMGNSETLMKIAQQSLLLLEPENLDYFLQAKMSYFLYGVYTDMEDFEKSRWYTLRAIEAAKLAGEINFLSASYAALGTTYTYRLDTKKTAGDLDSILYYTRLSGDMFYQYPGKVAPFTYAIARLNEASYLLKYQFKKQPHLRSQIVDSVKTVLDIMSSHIINGKEAIISNCYGILAAVAREEGNLSEAEEYLNSAMRKIDSSKTPQYYALNNILIDLSNIYAKKGDYKKAWETQNDLFRNNAQLFDERRMKLVNQLEAQYQAEKKEREVQVLKDKAKSQKKAQYLYMGLAGIGLLGTFFMFRSYHYNLKYSVEREKKLEAEKHDAETLILLQEEEQARLKTEQELLELQQQKLRDEVLMSQLQVQHKNEVLQSLKEKLTDDRNINIRQIIREENILDGDFEEAKINVQEVHPNFFKSISERAVQRLTPLDQKYCAYLYLGMDTKQIANLLNVEPKSVRMTRYRLKQKFGLDKETELSTFLKTIT